MTTILFTKDHIYCDTQCTRGNEVSSLNCIKFFPLSNGSIAFGAGSLSEIVASVAMYEGINTKLPIEQYINSRGSTLMIVNPDGFIEQYKPKKRQSRGDDAAASRQGVTPTLFWTGSREFIAIGSGRIHVENHYNYVDDNPKRAMINAAKLDIATGERMFELPRRWDRNKPLEIKFYNGLTRKDKHRAPVLVTLEFPKEPSWIYDVLTGKRSLDSIDIDQVLAK